MLIGIIVHSETGNTLSVAQKLQERLLAQGHTAVLERVVPETEKGKAVMGRLAASPETDGYDVLVFAAPVWAFSVSHVMKTYLGRLPSLQGKKTALFVTQSFRKPWLGGNRAIRWMKQACGGKGAVVVQTAVVNWNGAQRERQIEDLIEKFGRL